MQSTKKLKVNFEETHKVISIELIICRYFLSCSLYLFQHGIEPSLKQKPIANKEVVSGSIISIYCTSNSIHVFFYKKKVYKKMRLKWPTAQENHKAQLRKLSVFAGQKSILRHYYFQNVRHRFKVKKLETQAKWGFSYKKTCKPTKKIEYLG